MTRKHFELIAKAINLTYLPPEYDHVADTIRLHFARAMASHLADTNPAFNRERFVDACMKDTQS